MSSQELFLSVVLEWQRAEVGANDAQPHDREEERASRRTTALPARAHLMSNERKDYYSSASSSLSSESRSSSDASSDSEMEDIETSHSKTQRQLPGVEEISPTR